MPIKALQIPTSDAKRTRSPPSPTTVNGTRGC